MKENWKKIDDRYEISDMGNVKKNGIIIKQKPDSEGYKRFCFNGKTIRTHRLVAEHFCQKPNGKNQVNHKNNNKGDNRASNLEWVTHRENILLAGRDGLLNQGRKRDVVAVAKDGRSILFFESQKEASVALNVDDSSINKALRGKRPFVCGYMLRYKDEVDTNALILF